MSECNKFDEKLTAYVEGVLPEAEGRELMKHLESCDHCRAVLKDLKKTGDLLAGLEEKEPPPWFTQKVMARVREEAQPPKGLLRKLFFPLQIKIPIEVAASLLVAVLAWQVYKASPPEMKALPEAPLSSQVRQRETAPKDPDKEVTAGVPTTARRKKETKDSADAKGEGQITSRGGGTGEIKKQEEAVPAERRRAPEAPEPEEKKTAAADWAETAVPAPAPLKKTESAEIKSLTAPALQPAPRRMERELREKDERVKQKFEVAQDRAQVAGQAAKGRPQSVWTVRVRDADEALEKIRKWLQGAGAEHIREEGDADRRVISGRVGVGELDGLFDRLKALGEVSLQEHPGLAAGETGFISIEIILVLP